MRKGRPRCLANASNRRLVLATPSISWYASGKKATLVARFTTAPRTPGRGPYSFYPRLQTFLGALGAPPAFPAAGWRTKSIPESQEEPSRERKENGSCWCWDHDGKRDRPSDASRPGIRDTPG